MILVARMCAETRRKSLVLLCIWFCFLTLDVRSYSWHQLEVSKNIHKKKQNLKITSQSFHYTSDPWLLQSTVIVQWYLKQRHSLTYLTFVYIIVKLQTYCIFSSYVLSHVLFFLLLMTYMEYASVTAPALVTGKSKQSHLDSWFSVLLLILWPKQINAWLGSEASHEVIFILFQAFVAYYCRQNNAVKNKVSIQMIYLNFCLFLWHAACLPFYSAMLAGSVVHI